MLIGSRVTDVSTHPFDPNADAHCALNGWGVSYTTTHERCELHVYRFDSDYSMTKHDVHGTVHSTTEQARHLAYSCGVLGNYYRIYSD